MHNAHTRCATLYDRRNLMLGVPVVGLTTIVGTSIFATLASAQQRVWISVLIALLSIGAAVLASLQTFLRYSELSQKHKAAAVEYGTLRRRIEALLPRSDKLTDPESNESMEFIRSRWDTVEQESPSIPQRIYDLAASQYEVKV